jgi:hypothetical protein
MCVPEAAIGPLPIGVKRPHWAPAQQRTIQPPAAVDMMFSSMFPQILVWASWPAGSSQCGFRTTVACGERPIAGLVRPDKGFPI